MPVNPEHSEDQSHQPDFEADSGTPKDPVWDQYEQWLRRRRPEMTEQEIQTTIESLMGDKETRNFLASVDWEETKRLETEHPELFDPPEISAEERERREKELDRKLLALGRKLDKKKRR